MTVMLLGTIYDLIWVSLVAQSVRNLPTMQQTWVWSLGWKDSLEKRMATLSSILVWRIPWTEEPGVLQSMGLKRVRHDWATNTQSNSVCFCSVPKSRLNLCDCMDYSMPGFPVLCYLLEFAQTHVHWIGEAIQPSYPLLPSSPAFNLSQHQGFFQWVSSLHQVANVLELQLQHQSIQWAFRVDFL